MPYDAARALVVESVAPLGGPYQEAVRSGLYEERWVDVYPNAGKRPGGYCGGIHGTLPFIFLNYDDTLAGVLTLAHEVGHAAHALLARAAQPSYFSDPPFFIAGTSAGGMGSWPPVTRCPTVCAHVGFNISSWRVSWRRRPACRAVHVVAVSETRD